MPDGRLFIAGGYNGGSINSARFYQPDGDLWSTVAATLLDGRSLHTATLLPSGQVYLAGGRSPANTSLASVEVFDWATYGSIGVNDFRVVRTACNKFRT